jgi:hypothetical protein
MVRVIIFHQKICSKSNFLKLKKLKVKDKLSKKQKVIILLTKMHHIFRKNQKMFLHLNFIFLIEQNFQQLQ